MCIYVRKYKILKTKWNYILLIYSMSFLSIVYYESLLTIYNF